MTERLIEKLDRLGSEAGVEKMTPEIRRFAMLVRADTAAAWPFPPHPMPVPANAPPVKFNPENFEESPF